MRISLLSLLTFLLAVACSDSHAGFANDPTIRIAQEKTKNLSLKKWKATTSHLGAMAERPSWRTAKCFVGNVIGGKGASRRKTPAIIFSIYFRHA